MPTSTVSDYTTPLLAPAWATSHELDEGGIRWTRAAAVEVLPALIDGDPDVIKVDAVQVDDMRVVDGTVTVSRDPAVDIYLESYRMTAVQARRLAGALLDVAGAVEAAEVGAAPGRQAGRGRRQCPAPCYLSSARHRIRHAQYLRRDR